MGLRAFDQYSILHFAAGVIAYFWSLSFVMTIIIHILFEYIEFYEQISKLPYPYGDAKTFYSKNFNTASISSFSIVCFP